MLRLVLVMALVASCVATNGNVRKVRDPCGAIGGTCKDESACASKNTKSGLCAGGKTTKCCLPATPAAPVSHPTTAPSTPAPTQSPPTPTPAGPVFAQPPGTVATFASKVTVAPLSHGARGVCSVGGQVGFCRSSAGCASGPGKGTFHSGVCLSGQGCCIPAAGESMGQVGIDVENGRVTTTKAQCYLNSGLSFFVLRAWRPSGVVDPDVVPNLKTFASVGAKNLDVYWFADFRKPVGPAVQAMFKNLRDNGVFSLVNRVWLDIERDINGAYMWNKNNLAQNFAKLKDAIAAVKAEGKLPGIYAPGAGGWAEMMGTNKLDENVPMWYVSKHGYNNDASDADWVPFGNWKIPGMHQFASDGVGGNLKVCGQDGVDWSYRRTDLSEYPTDWDVTTNQAVFKH